MAKTFVQRGDVMTVTVGADIAAGVGLLIGQIVGVSQNTLLSGASGAFDIEGVHEMDKLTTAVLGQGDPLYWDESAKEWTDVTTTNWYAGTCWVAAGNGATVVQVKLHPGGKDIVEA